MRAFALLSLVLAVSACKIDDPFDTLTSITGLLTDSTTDVTASGTKNERLQIVVAATGGSAEAAARRAQRVVEWAVAARMLELHGGELETNEQRPGPVKCVLTLPLAR